MMFVSFKVVIALILVIVLKPVVPMTNAAAVDSSEGNYCLMKTVQKDIVENCHNSDIDSLADCCHSGCDSNNISLLFRSRTPFQISNSIEFNSSFINLYSIYAKPATPPPIQA